MQGKAGIGEGLAGGRGWEGVGWGPGLLREWGLTIWLGAQRGMISMSPSW